MKYVLSTAILVTGISDHLSSILLNKLKTKKLPKIQKIRISSWSKESILMIIFLILNKGILNLSGMIFCKPIDVDCINTRFIDKFNEL